MIGATSDRIGSWSQCMHQKRNGAFHRVFAFERLSLTPTLSRPPSAVAVPREPLKVRAGRLHSKATQFTVLRRTGWERENGSPIVWYDEQSSRFRGSMRDLLRGNPTGQARCPSHYFCRGLFQIGLMGLCREQQLQPVADISEFALIGCAEFLNEQDML